MAMLRVRPDSSSQPYRPMMFHKTFPHVTASASLTQSLADRNETETLSTDAYHPIRDRNYKHNRDKTNAPL